MIFRCHYKFPYISLYLEPPHPSPQAWATCDHPRLVSFSPARFQHTTHTLHVIDIWQTTRAVHVIVQKEITSGGSLLTKFTKLDQPCFQQLSNSSWLTLKWSTPNFVRAEIILFVIHKRYRAKLKLYFSGRWISFMHKRRISNDQENEKRSAIFQIQSATWHKHSFFPGLLWNSWFISSPIKWLLKISHTRSITCRRMRINYMESN